MEHRIETTLIYIDGISKDVTLIPELPCKAAKIHIITTFEPTLTNTLHTGLCKAQIFTAINNSRH